MRETTSIDLKVFLYHLSSYSSYEELLRVLPAGTTVERMLDEAILSKGTVSGVDQYRFTSKAKRLMVEQALENPVASCMYWWDLMVDRTNKKLNVMEFALCLFHTHNIIDSLTDGEVNFAKVIATKLDEGGT